MQPRRAGTEDRSQHSEAFGLKAGCKTADKDHKRFQYDLEVYPDRHVLDVVEVVTHLLGLFFEIVRIVITNLRPASDPGTDRAAECVVRNRVAEELQVTDGVRPRSNQIHVTPDHIHKLRQLVDS